jgi:hypothetical protein
MNIKQVQSYLREIDTTKQEIKIEYLDKFYAYKYNDNVKLEELEAKLGEFVELIFHDGILTRVS